MDDPRYRQFVPIFDCSTRSQKPLWCQWLPIFLTLWKFSLAAAKSSHNNKLCGKTFLKKLHVTANWNLNSFRQVSIRY